jgi:multidrug efflux pump subunit AcrA (membrane-fusion protein)
MKQNARLVVFAVGGLVVVLASGGKAHACNASSKVRLAPVERHHQPDSGEYVALLGSPRGRAAARPAAMPSARVPVYVEVPAERLEALSPDALVELFDIRGNVVGAGPVSFVSPEVDAAAQTVLLGTVIEDDLGLLRGGRPLRARVVFHFGHGVTVPADAVWRDRGRSFVWVAEVHGAEMVARRRAVTLGARVGDAWFVRTGVARGERVVVDGGYPLADGASITATP